MRKSYIYYFNSQEVSRKELLELLKQDCQKIVCTDWVGDIGIDLMGLDEESYRQNIRAIDDGTKVCFMKSRNCYYRKVK